MPFGPLRSVLTSRTSPWYTAKTPLNGSSFLRVVEELRKTEWRIGKVTDVPSDR